MIPPPYMRQYFTAILIVYSFVAYSQYTNAYGFVNVRNATEEFSKNNDQYFFLRQWDTLFYNEHVSVLYKVDFLNNWAFRLPTDTLVARVKKLALLNGYDLKHNQHSNVYHQLQFFDSVNQTSTLYQIDSLAQIWQNHLLPQKQLLNIRLRNLWKSEHKYYQAYHSNNRDSVYLPILYKLMEEYIDICREQGYVPNSFDNNWDDQSNYMVVFLHLASTHKSIARLNIWEYSLPYFISTFKAGKITNEFCYFYDLNLKSELGVQYFGTLKNVPIKDEETIEQRKIEYDIDNLKEMLRELKLY